MPFFREVHENESKTLIRSSHSRKAGAIASVCTHVCAQVCCKITGRRALHGSYEQIYLQIRACFAGDSGVAALRVGTLRDVVFSRWIFRRRRIA